MKLLATPVLALCLMVMIGCAEGNAPSPEISASIAEATNKVEANVTGMDCNGCSGSIESAVAGIDGVTAVHADLKSGDVKVALTDDADAEATMAEVEKVIAGLSDGKFTVNTIAVSTAGDDAEHAEEESEKEEPEATEEPQVDAGTGETLFTVSGMTCSACSDKVTKAVSAVEGVESVYVCHKSGKASVVAADGAKVCSTSVAKAIEATGFKVEKPCASGCEKGSCDSKKKAAGSEGTVFTVSGMTCSACSDKVTKAVSAVEGVESVYVCHKSGKASVVAADGAKVCSTSVAKAIEATGFKVEKPCASGCEKGGCDSKKEAESSEGEKPQA